MIHHHAYIQKGVCALSAIHYDQALGGRTRAIDYVDQLGTGLVLLLWHLSRIDFLTKDDHSGTVQIPGESCVMIELGFAIFLPILQKPEVNLFPNRYLAMHL